MTDLVRRVLDHGTVELLDWMGDDLAIVNAAKASFDKSSPVYGPGEAAILRFLMREEHGVPFEHAVLKFRITMPLFIAAQFKKHRISSWSEQSGRYDEMSPLCYVPAIEDCRRQKGKPGAYTFEPMTETQARSYQWELQGRSERSWSDYQYDLSVGVAKELARLALTPNFYTTVVWTINVRSLLNVVHLRFDSHAQREAQVYAEAMEQLAELIVPDTIAAFRAAGRKVP